MQDATDENKSSDTSIFISYAEEDSDIALEIAQALRVEGYGTWTFQENNTFARSYLEEIDEAIEKSAAFLVLISPASLASEQVITEVERAYEAHKHFLPVRSGISHADFQSARGPWRMAIGTTLIVEVPSGNVSAVVPKLLKGLSNMKRGHASLEATRPSVPAKRREPIGQLLARIFRSTPLWARLVLLLFDILLTYMVRARNFISGECLIREEDGSESPFRDGTVSFLVDNKEVTVDLRDQGYWAAPLESELPLRGVVLNFELNERRYPVRIGFASILMNRSHTI